MILKSFGHNNDKALFLSVTKSPSAWRAFGLVTALFALLSGSLSAQTKEDTPTPKELKKLSLEELMNLDVTSVAKEPEPFREAPAAIQVVTHDEIHRSGASRIPEALRLADNLDVAQQNAYGWSISARGFNAGLANKLLVLFDGRAIYTPLYSGVFWNAQDYLLEDLDRIEVVSGPGGTLWGSNAVNGVINITSKSAEDTQGVYLETGGGTSLRYFGGARYGGQLDKRAFFRVYGKFFDRDGEVFANGTDVGDTWRMGQGGFRIDGETEGKDQLTLQGDLYGSDINVPAGDEVANGGNVLGRWSKTLSEDSSLSLQMYYDRTHLDLPARPGGRRLPDDLDTYDVDFQHHLSLNEWNRAAWGIGYRFTHDVVGNTPDIAFIPPVLDHNLFNFFAQDEVTLDVDLFFTVGAKLESNDYTGWEFEPSARLKWDFSPKHMLWAAVSRAVRTPSRIDRDLVIPYSSSPLLFGGASFRSETVGAFELGYRAQIAPELTTSVSTFFNHYDNLRSISPAPSSTFPLTIANDLEGETYGGELTADLQLVEGWILHAGYDLLKEDIRVEPGKTDFNNGLADTADPENQIFLRSSANLGDKVDFDLGSRWVDTRRIVSGTLLGTVPSYFEFDARLAWRPGKDVEISVVGQNLFQDHHPEYGFPNAAREEIQRSVYGKLTWQL
jgi:iron complex outermembrane receptor protein